MGPEDLRRALGGLKTKTKDRRVLVDQSTMDDAGVFAIGRSDALVQTVDFFTPVVDDPYDYGQIAAANSVSDVYAMGGTPMTALGLLCFPETGLPPEVPREILRGGLAKMREAGVSVIGGHSVRDEEIKFGYAVTGLVGRRKLLTNAGARPGDQLVMTKPLGTGILATALKQRKLDDRLLRRVTKSMTTLNRQACEAAVEYKVRACTDVSGYALLGHASQMADASEVTFRIHPNKSWFFPRTLELAEAGAKAGGLDKNREYYGKRVVEKQVDPRIMDALYDPQTSGGLLLSVPPRRLEGLLGGLKKRRVWSVVLGEVLPRARHAIDVDGG